jgi:hypothetical protein
MTNPLTKQDLALLQDLLSIIKANPTAVSVQSIDQIFQLACKFIIILVNELMDAVKKTSQNTLPDLANMSNAAATLVMKRY